MSTSKGTFIEQKNTAQKGHLFIEILLKFIQINHRLLLTNSATIKILYIEKISKIKSTGS